MSVCVCSYVCVCDRIQQGGRDCSSTGLLDGQLGDFHLYNVAKQLSIDPLMATNVGRISSCKITDRLSSLMVHILNHYAIIFIDYVWLEREGNPFPDNVCVGFYAILDGGNSR